MRKGAKKGRRHPWQQGAQGLVGEQEVRVVDGCGNACEYECEFDAWREMSDDAVQNRSDVDLDEG